MSVLFLSASGFALVTILGGAVEMWKSICGSLLSVSVVLLGLGCFGTDSNDGLAACEYVNQTVKCRWCCHSRDGQVPIEECGYAQVIDDPTQPDRIDNRSLDPRSEGRQYWQTVADYTVSSDPACVNE